MMSDLRYIAKCPQCQGLGVWPPDTISVCSKCQGKGWVPKPGLTEQQAMRWIAVDERRERIMYIGIGAVLLIVALILIFVVF